jgi:hypothetical protein
LTTFINRRVREQPRNTGPQGPQGPQGADGPAGSGSSATTVEVNLGSLRFSGKFTITDAAITTTSKILCWQAPGPYTGKGTRADEAEMQPVLVTAVQPLSGTATVMWQTPPMIVQSVAGNEGRRDAAGATFDRLVNQRLPVTTEQKRIGKVGGSVKFTYMVFN